MYLIKYLSRCGVCSRRKAADAIKAGHVAVNGVVVTVPYHQVHNTDEVTYNGTVVTPESHVYILLNKPKDYITTCSDDRGRKTVLDLLGEASDTRLFPVGRLDRMSTGVLLITNDGALAQKLAHPSQNVAKVYRVRLDKILLRKDFNKLRDGFTLEDGFIKVDRCSYKGTDVVLEIHSGKNRIIRRMFEYLTYNVKLLDRISFAGLSKEGLKPGQWRYLTKSEVASLM